MYKSHLKARRGASQGGTPLAEIDSTSVESAWSVRARLSVRQKAISDGILAMRHLYRILKMPSAIPISPSPSPKK